MAIAVRPAGPPSYAAVGHNHDGRYALLGSGGGGDIPPEYVTESELAAALGPYATDADVAALAARVSTLEAQVAALQAQMSGHTHLSGTIAAAGGTAVMP